MPSNKPKIVYVTTARLPTEKAHGLATVKICEALAEAGCDVDLVIPWLWRKSQGDIFDHYSLKRNFRVYKIPCIDLIPLKFFDSFFFLIQSVTFSIIFSIFALFKYRNEKVVYFSHDYIPLFFSTFLPGKVLYDIHHFPGKNFLYKRLMRKSFSFAVQTKWKIGELSKRYGIPADLIVYWPNGTDVNRFNIRQTKDETRDILGLSHTCRIAVYTGSLFDWKGVDSFIKSVKYVPENSLLYIVGGSSNDIEYCKKNIEEANDQKIVFVPFEPHHRIPLWLKAADVLVLPNTGKQKVSLYYTSPMKLFEYMAAGRPIVASAIPSILEVVDDTNAVLVEPDNPEAFGRGVVSVFNNADLAANISEKALGLAQKYTWIERAKKITSLIERNA